MYDWELLSIHAHFIQYTLPVTEPHDTKDIVLWYNLRDLAKEVKVSPLRCGRRDDSRSQGCLNLGLLLSSEPHVNVLLNWCGCLQPLRYRQLVIKDEELLEVFLTP